MKCYICDVELDDKEIIFDYFHQTWKPCSECLEESNPPPKVEVVEDLVDFIVLDDIGLEEFLNQNGNKK